MLLGARRAYLGAAGVDAEGAAYSLACWDDFSDDEFVLAQNKITYTQYGL